MQSKAQIDQILRQKSDAQDIPGVVAMAASGKDVIYQGAFGKRDLSKDDAMTLDSVFWIASMTKAVTTAGAMQLVEQDKLALDEPIGKLLPDLASPQVLEGFDAQGEPKLRPAKKPITLRQLMTHTAGFCYELWNSDKATYLEKTGTPGITTCQNAALKTPLASDPGTRWEYGTNIDFVGKAVEAVSGKRLDAYLRDHLFTPLGMHETAFKITDNMRKRLVGMHMRGDDGKTRTKFVLFFEGLDKAMVLNATNKDVLADNFGRVPAKWIGATVGILVDNNVMFQGKRTKGLRLRHIAAPKATVTEPPPFDDPTPSAAA